MLSIVVSHRTNISSITLIHEIVFKILGKIAEAWEYDHNDLDFITLNVDVINMSDAHAVLQLGFEGRGVWGRVLFARSYKNEGTMSFDALSIRTCYKI